MGGKGKIRRKKMKNKCEIKYEHPIPFLFFSLRLHLDSWRKGNILRG